MSFLHKFVQKLILACLLCGVFAAPSLAQDMSQAYKVSGIQAFETADNLEQAKKQAMEKARFTAATSLLKRLTADHHHAEIAAMSENLPVGKWLHAIQVKNEKTSPTSYRAELQFDFKPESVQAFLRKKGWSYADQEKPVTLILPFYDRGDTVLLYEPENLWRQSWINQESLSGLVPVKTATADILPLGMTAAKEVMDNPDLIAAALPQGYSTDRALLLRAKVSVLSQNTGGSQLRIDISFVPLAGGGVPTMSSPISYMAPVGEDLAAAFDGAARQVMRLFEKNWKDQLFSGGGFTASLEVLLPLRDLGGWADAQRRLSSMAEVRQIRLRAMTRNMAQLAIDLSDRPENLIAQFQSHGFKLTPNAPLWLMEAY